MNRAGTECFFQFGWAFVLRWPESRAIAKTRHDRDLDLGRFRGPACFTQAQRRIGALPDSYPRLMLTCLARRSIHHFSGNWGRLCSAQTGNSCTVCYSGRAKPLAGERHLVTRLAVAAAVAAEFGWFARTGSLCERREQSRAPGDLCGQPAAGKWSGPRRRPPAARWERRDRPPAHYSDSLDRPPCSGLAWPGSVQSSYYLTLLGQQIRCSHYYSI